jgi:hypothetical protein
MTERLKAKAGERGGKARIDGFRENPSIPAITVVQAGIGKNLAQWALEAQGTDKHLQRFKHLPDRVGPHPLNYDESEHNNQQDQCKLGSVKA